MFKVFFETTIKVYNVCFQTNLYASRKVEKLTVENMVQDGWKKWKSFREIYSPELELKKENDINTVGSFLDLRVKIR